MTKLTYEAQISVLEEVDSDYSSVVSRWSAESIAGDADDEIQKLKGLLDNACWLLADSGCKNFIDEIEKALYD